MKAKHYDQGTAFDKEYRSIRLDDQAERWVHGLGKLEFDAQERPLKMHGTIQDITVHFPPLKWGIEGDLFRKNLNYSAAKIKHQLSNYN